MICSSENLKRFICPSFLQGRTLINGGGKSGGHVRYVQRIYLEGQAEGKLAIQIVGVGCSADGCEKHAVMVALGNAYHSESSWRMVSDQDFYFDQMIYPHGAAKPQPDYIPTPLREDYIEACLIRDLSPKASATLVRRCLQGMIRDFCGISKPTLFAEINALREAVGDGKAPEGISLDSVDAIDAVRGIGNIGAHMEKDISVIVDVDPGEAQVLIELVEMLFDEWYIARHKRQQRLLQIQQLAATKKIEIAAQKELRAASEAGESEQ